MMQTLNMQVGSLSDAEKARLRHLERRLLLAAVGIREATDILKHTCGASHEMLTGYII